MKTTPCPICGSTSARAHDSATGACTHPDGCNRRRCHRRCDEDARRGVREQCSATTGQRSVLFCVLRKGHGGLHLHGTKEWGGSYQHPVAKALLAGVGATDIKSEG